MRHSLGNIHTSPAMSGATPRAGAAASFALRPSIESIAARAKVWLEEHLFEPFHAPELARAMHASESTVLRMVRKELGVAPAVYLRRRRLEEAMLLLETGRYGVTEVAARVGYENPSAFAAAFRRELGVAPSSVKARVDTATRLPAHGAPPVRRRRRR